MCSFKSFFMCKKVSKDGQMKKNSSILLLLFLAFLLTACSSRENDMAMVIKKSISETLQNPDSYKPIETIIDSLRNDRYGDTLIFDNVMKDIEARKKFYSAEKGFKEKRDIIHNLLDHGNTAGVDSERDEMDDYLKEMETQAAIMKSLEVEIKAFEKKCDGKFYGWLVTHKFDYLSKDGELSNCTYIMFVDKECRIVYRFLDEDKTPYDAYKKYIDMIINGELK